MRSVRAKLQQLGANVQQLRAEAGEGTRVGYVFALAVAIVCSTIAYLAAHDHGEPFPWAPITVVFAAALSGPLRGTWKRRHDRADPTGEPWQRAVRPEADRPERRKDP